MTMTSAAKMKLSALALAISMAFATSAKGDLIVGGFGQLQGGQSSATLVNARVGMTRLGGDVRFNDLSVSDSGSGDTFSFHEFDGSMPVNINLFGDENFYGNEILLGTISAGNAQDSVDLSIFRSNNNYGVSADFSDAVFMSHHTSLDSISAVDLLLRSQDFDFSGTSMGTSLMDLEQNVITGSFDWSQASWTLDFQDLDGFHTTTQSMTTPGDFDFQDAAAVPEPSSLVLLATGTGILVLSRYWRRKEDEPAVEESEPSSLDM